MSADEVPLYASVSPAILTVLSLFSKGRRLENTVGGWLYIFSVSNITPFYI